MDEAQRIELIAQTLTRWPGKKIAILVDTGPGHEDKGDRYIRGVRAFCPKVQIHKRFNGPTAGAETIVFVLPLDEPAGDVR